MSRRPRPFLAVALLGALAALPAHADPGDAPPAMEGPAPAAATGSGIPLFREHGPPVVIARDGARVEVTRTDGRWWVTGTDNQRRLADADGVERLLAYLDGLSVERRVAPFGRPRPEAFARPLAIRMGTDDVRVGGPSRIPGLSYVERGDGAVYLARPVNLDPATLRLVDRRLFPNGLGAIDEIDLTGPDVALHASRKFGPWRLTAPAPSPADRDAIDRWLAGLAALKGDPAQVPPDDAGAYQAVLTSVEGRTLRIGLLPDGRVTLGGLAFAADGGTGGLIPDRFAWMEKTVVRVPGDGITGIQVQQAERTVVLTRRGGGPWVEKGTGQIYKSWATDLFAFLDPLKAKELRPESAPSLGTAQVEVRLWKDRELLATVELWMGKDGRWWARAGEDMSVYEIAGDLPEHLARLF